MKKSFLILSVVCLMANLASATWYWEGDVSSAWSNPNNWNDGAVSPPATVPHSAGESMYIPRGTPAVDADTSDTMGLLMVARGGSGSATLNLNTAGVTLTVTKASTELVSVCYDGSATGTINVSAGKLLVYRGNGTGEIRLAHVYDATCVANLNLSGTGVIDVETLNRGAKTASNATFNATGGTLVVRNKIFKWGIVTDGGGFSQGGCLLEVAAYGTQNIANSIGALSLGDSSNQMDYFMDSTSKLMVDLDASGACDTIVSYGNFVVDGQLQVRITGTPTIGQKWNVWSVASALVGTASGSGSFDSVPSYIRVNWIDTGNGTDILQLEYIPEPATIALLGLGLIAIRRRK